VDGDVSGIFERTAVADHQPEIVGVWRRHQELTSSLQYSVKLKECGDAIRERYVLDKFTGDDGVEFVLGSWYGGAVSAVAPVVGVRQSVDPLLHDIKCSKANFWPRLFQRHAASSWTCAYVKNAKWSWRQVARELPIPIGSERVAFDSAHCGVQRCIVA
jgi:hypothetical protein